MVERSDSSNCLLTSTHTLGHMHTCMCTNTLQWIIKINVNKRSISYCCLNVGKMLPKDRFTLCGVENQRPRIAGELGCIDEAHVQQLWSPVTISCVRKRGECYSCVFVVVVWFYFCFYEAGTHSHDSPAWLGPYDVAHGGLFVHLYIIILQEGKTDDIFQPVKSQKMSPFCPSADVSLDSRGAWFSQPHMKQQHPEAESKNVIKIK